MKKVRINGQQMASHVGQEVILLGSVSKVSPNGKQFELTTLDKKPVNVTLQEPIDGNISEGMVECHGVLQSKATMLCNTCVHFSPDMCESFDPEQYNDLLSILNLLGNQKWKLSETDPGLY